MVRNSMTKFLAFSLLVASLGNNMLEARKKDSCALNCICKNLNALSLGCDILQKKADQIIACACNPAACPKITYIRSTDPFPYPINEAGTYVLCDDIILTTGTAIIITSPNVSLDLAGNGIAAPMGIELGTTDTAVYNIHIFNGTISSFRDNGCGIKTDNQGDYNILIDHVLLAGGSQTDAHFAGPDGLALDFNDVGNVFVRDCKIVSNESDNRPLITVAGCVNVVFDGCAITDNTYSKLISLDGSEQVFLQNCDISCNAGFALPDPSESNYVLYMNDTLASCVFNCKFVANRAAENMNSSVISINASDPDNQDQYNSIMNCQFIDNMQTGSTGSGVSCIYIDSSHNYIEGCLINGISALNSSGDSSGNITVVGIVCSGVLASYNTIEQCIVESITGAGENVKVRAYGISLDDGDYNDIEDCVIQHITATTSNGTEFTCGIYVSVLNSNTIVRNKVFDYGTSSFDHGIYILLSSGIGAVIGNTVGVGYYSSSPLTYNNYFNVPFVVFPPTGNNPADSALNINSGYTNVALNVNPQTP